MGFLDLFDGEAVFRKASVECEKAEDRLKK